MGLAAQRLAEDGAEGGERQRLHAVLQFPQFEDEGVRQHVRPHREQLAELDEGGAEFLRGEPGPLLRGAHGPGRGQQVVPEARRQIDLLEQIGEAVAGEYRQDLLCPDRVAQEVERLHDAGISREAAASFSSRVRTRASRASMRSRCLRSK